MSSMLLASHFNSYPSSLSTARMVAHSTLSSCHEVSLLNLLNDMPASLPLSEKIQTIRSVCRSMALREISTIPRRPQRMAPAVEVVDCTWQGNNGFVPIKIIGIRHGRLRINKTTSDRIKEILSETKPSAIFCEQGLNPMLRHRGIKTGQEITDQVVMGHVFPQLYTSLVYALYQGVALSVGLFHSVQRAIAGPAVRQDHHHGFNLSYQTYGFMPERLEIEAHELLPKNIAINLDNDFNGHRINGRSAYMAGWVAANAEKYVENEQPIVVFCGGVHQARIASLLNYGASTNIPGSIVPYFRFGFDAGIAAMSCPATPKKVSLQKI